LSLLTVDIGNSRISLGLVEGTRVLDHFEGFPSTGERESEQRAAEAFDWCLDQSAAADIDGLVIASVVPAQRRIFEALCQGHPDFASRPVHVVDARSPLPFEVDVSEPDTVGADRYCNVAGAVAMGHDTAIVVDLGTANTFDLLEGGVFRGGLIGVGAATAHRALVRSGAQLPESTFSYPTELVGRSTVEAMRAGSWYQAVGAVRHVIGLLERRASGAAVLVTGGLAEVLGPELGESALHLPGLTHVGAAAIGSGSPDLGAARG
jgi:type III pantothenate kinase